MATGAPGSHTSQSWPSIFIGKINITSNRFGEGKDIKTLYFHLILLKGWLGSFLNCIFCGSCKIRFNDRANFYVAIWITWVALYDFSVSHLLQKFVFCCQCSLFAGLINLSLFVSGALLLGLTVWSLMRWQFSGIIKEFKFSGKK